MTIFEAGIEQISIAPRRKFISTSGHVYNWNTPPPPKKTMIKKTYKFEIYVFWFTPGFVKWSKILQRAFGDFGV